MYDFLRKVPLFAELPEDDLRTLSETVAEVRISEGEEIFAEGDPGDRAYVIQEGQIEILKQSSGRDVLLVVRETGEVIGEMALLEEAPRMATARARSDRHPMRYRQGTRSPLTVSCVPAYRPPMPCSSLSWSAPAVPRQCCGRAKRWRS